MGNRDFEFPLVAALLITSLAAPALTGCETTGAGSTTGSDAGSQTSCPPGTTILQPRTLAQDHFSGLDVTDGQVLATGIDLQRLPLSGGPIETIAQASTMRGLVIVGQTAYFTADHPLGAPDVQGRQAATTALYSVPLSGGATALVLDAPLNIDGAVADSRAIYFNGFGGGIVRVAVADGSRTDLALPAGLYVDAIAVNGGAVYVAAQDLASTSPTNGLIMKMPATGGPAQTLITNIGHPWNLVADASGLFWVEDPPVGTFGDGHLAGAALDGSAMRTLLSHGARALAISRGDLYFAWSGIGKVPVGGGAETTLVPGLNAPGMLHISGGSAVWVDPVSQARSDPTVPSLMTTCL